MISGAVGPGDHDNETSSIWLISILGGTPRRLRGDALRAELSPDDLLVAYMSENGIWLADADGKNPREFIEPRDWESVGSPVWSADGKRVIYVRVAQAEGGPVATIESRGLDEDHSIVLARDKPPGKVVSFLPWAKSLLMLEDRLVYTRAEPAPRTREGNLWEIAIDRRSGEPRGEPSRLTDWVGVSPVVLSATADGSQLAFLNNRSQIDVHVGELGEGGRSFGNVRRLTLDNRDDMPSCWTADGRALVFQSDRNGNWDLFVQGLEQRNAQPLVSGAGDQVVSQLTPDGTSFLYWESRDADAGPSEPRRLLRIPAEGGPTELILETQGEAWLECASTPDGPCLLFEHRLEQRVIAVSEMDPVSGKGREFWQLDRDPSLDPKWSLSPDGSQVALVGHTEDGRLIRLVDALTGDVVRDVELQGLPGMSFANVAWSSDGGGFYAVGDSPRGMALLRVDPGGEAWVLYEHKLGFFTSVEPSPQGRHLAFGMLTMESNVWMIEEF